MNRDIKEILISREEIAQTVGRLGQEITADYQGKNPIIISVLKGAFIFMADLVRHIDTHCAVDFMSVSSYGSGTTTSGEVRIIKDLDTNIEGRHVIIVEDILDSGMTLSYLKKLLSARKPASIAICSLFDKPARHKAPITLDYKGIEVPDEFIVGYGLDYDERYRNLPDVCILREEIYAKE